MSLVVEEDSLADITVTDPGPEMTMSNKSTAQESTTRIVTTRAAAVGHKLQICACGWKKVTSQLGLRSLQGDYVHYRKETETSH